MRYIGLKIGYEIKWKKKILKKKKKKYYFLKYEKIQKLNMTLLWVNVYRDDW